MAWSVDNIYKFAQFLIRKNQAGGISANDLFYAWNSEQKMYQSDLLGRFQARSNGKLGSNTGLIENETILTKLAPFTKPATLTIAAGQATKPTDFVYTLAIRIVNEKVFSMAKDEIWYVKNDVIDPPSTTDGSYFYTEYLNYYSFLPNTVTSADLDYIAAPTDIVWAYTIDGDGRQVYSAAGGGGVTPTTGSVQPQWDDLSIIEITKRSLKVLGVSFKDQDFSQFGNPNIITGD